MAELIKEYKNVGYTFSLFDNRVVIKQKTLLTTKTETIFVKNIVAIEKSSMGKVQVKTNDKGKYILLLQYKDQTDFVEQLSNLI